MPELTEDDWLQIGEAYRSGASASSLSRIHQISRQAIDAKAKRMGWRKGEFVEAVKSEVDSRAHAIADGTDGIAEEALEAALDRAADARAEIIKEHRKQWAAMQKTLADGMQLLHVPQDPEEDPGATSLRLKRAETMLNIFSKGTNAIFMYQEGQRRAHGFDYKAQKSEAADQASKKSESDNAWADVKETLKDIAKKAGVDPEEIQS
jgi:hypothetical protein